MKVIIRPVPQSANMLVITYNTNGCHLDDDIVVDMPRTEFEDLLATQEKFYKQIAQLGQLYEEQRAKAAHHALHPNDD